MKSQFILIVTIILTTASFVANCQDSANDTIYIPDPANKSLVTIEVRNSKKILVLAGRMMNKKKEGIFRTYDEFENVSQIQEFHNGIADGILLKFGSNGALQSEENYKWGKLNGKHVMYRFGGIKSLVEYYADGKLDGIKITFYDNGFKQEEASYKNGLRNGITKWFNQNEIIIIENTYKNGTLQGLCKTFFFNGKTESEGFYENDSETGEWKYYDENGKLIKSIFYESGKIVKEVKY